MPSIQYKQISYLRILFAISAVSAALLLFSCKPTRYVPDGGYLLNKINVDCNCRTSNINKEELESYIKQKPNTRLLGVFRFHLWVYNMLNHGSDRKWKKKIKEVIGEPPVIYDAFLTEKTRNQFKLYLEDKGFFKAIVKDTVILGNKKAKITYYVRAEKPYSIRNISFYFQDETLNFLANDTAGKTILKKGRRYDVDDLQKERIRITNVLKNLGYYRFTKEYIDFKVDSSLSDHKVDINLRIRKSQQLSADEMHRTNHKKYIIRNLLIYPDFNSGKALQDQSGYLSVFDTLNYQGCTFIGKMPMAVRPAVIARSLYIMPGSLYKLSDVDESYKLLSELQQYKIINIQFAEAGLNTTEGTDTFPNLDCIIQLSPFTQQSYELEMEGKNSSGNIGFGGNVNYHHYNLLGGAENFNFKVAGSLEVQTNVAGNSGKKFLPNTVEYSAETRLNIPEFLLPFSFEKFNKQYNPKTAITLSYNYQNRPDYNRTISNIAFGYYWKTSKYLKHWFNPVELNAVRLRNITDAFRNSIQDPYLLNSFEDQFISVSSYSLLFINQDINKLRNFIYIKFNTEIAGNILSALDRMAGEHKTEGGYYELFGTRFAQYFKSDIEFKYYQVFSKAATLVYRSFAGIGIPYGNSDAIPFIKEYFAGGANSIRAWPVRSVGPGSYNDTTSIPNSLGDIKLEANIEYRFNMFWILKGAFFLDAGNIWALNQMIDKQPGADFNFNRFYKEFAVGTGFGLRFDFNYFVFRTDFGIKMVDPRKPEGHRWVLGTKPFSISDIVLNIGVAYPF
ncbi:MAG: BamA/TamA family outer membrane protein [Bacteroidia bacterium]|nr:BamA/TamA family outer membrane protein [Bacteroidia bacterium]